MELLCRVDGTFTVPSRGRAVAVTELQARCRRGDKILLRTPSGDEIHTQIKAIEMLKCATAPFTRVAIMLPEEIKKEDVSTGTEVWLIQQHASGEARHPS
jgi:hypothetical protein